MIFHMSRPTNKKKGCVFEVSYLFKLTCIINKIFVLKIIYLNSIRVINKAPHRLFKKIGNIVYVHIGINHSKPKMKSIEHLCVHQRDNFIF